MVTQLVSPESVFVLIVPKVQIHCNAFLSLYNYVVLSFLLCVFCFPKLRTYYIICLELTSNRQSCLSLSIAVVYRPAHQV